MPRPGRRAVPAAPYAGRHASTGRTRHTPVLPQSSSVLAHHTFVQRLYLKGGNDDAPVPGLPVC